MQDCYKGIAVVCGNLLKPELEFRTNETSAIWCLRVCRALAHAETAYRCVKAHALRALACESVHLAVGACVGLSSRLSSCRSVHRSIGLSVCPSVCWSLAASRSLCLSLSHNMEINHNPRSATVNSENVCSYCIARYYRPGTPHCPPTPSILREWRRVPTT